MNFRLQISAALLAGVLLAGAPRPALAAKSDLREAVAQLAASIKAIVEKEGQNTIRIGVFSPLGRDENAGASISAVLAEQLAGFVDKKAVLEIQGSYGFVADPKESGLKVVKIKAKIVDTNTLEDKKLFLPLEGVVRDTGSLGHLLFVTGSVPTEIDGNPTQLKQRNEALQKNIVSPSCHLHGQVNSLISSSPGSPYAIEIRAKPLVGGEGQAPQPRPAAQKDGQAFVDVGKGEVYAIRILNNSKREVGVTVTIDGVDVFAFSDDRQPDGRPKFSHFVIAPGKETTVPGWHKSVDPSRPDSFLSFLVTELGKGAASKFPTQSQGKIGGVTVAFCHSLPKGTARSAGETGFGPPVHVQQKPVERVFEPPHEFISVRYER